MSKTDYSISKTSFLKFEQCHKAFFLYKKHPYLRDKVSTDKRLTFKRGHEVGFFARELFPGGTNVAALSKNSSEALVLTRELILAGTQVIYEATFVYEGVLIMIDILCFEEEKYTAYEVKSSLKISETYLKDACLQYYVIKHILPNLEDLFLVTLHPDYILESPLDVRNLFRKRSVKSKAEENFTYFEHQIKEAHEVVEKNAIPNIAIGKQCFKPYVCDFFGTCWKDTSHENSVFNLPFIDRGQLFEWHNNGLRFIEQISDDMIVKDQWIKIKNSFVAGKAIVNTDKIRQFMANIRKPAIAMDMEIWSPAIPQLPGARCFEQVPFLVCFFDGAVHTSFFTDHRPDGREEFARQLILLSSAYESILVYDKTMEVSAINVLIQKFPHYKTELEALKNKLADIFDIFLNLHYYHPDFKSNFSLKTVSSVLLKDVNYSKITSGLEAMNFFEQYLLNDNELERDLLRKDLTDYCNTDCTATFELAGFLARLGE
ncbi:MAG: DUF2779 domain-containing protein [bacterium]|nr:DUF2779 domain-containing protein [bacterium]